MHNKLVGHLRSPGEHFQNPPVERGESSSLAFKSENKDCNCFYSWDTAGRQGVILKVEIRNRKKIFINFFLLRTVDVYLRLMTFLLFSQYKTLIFLKKIFSYKYPLTTVNTFKSSNQQFNFILYRFINCLRMLGVNTFSLFAFLSSSFHLMLVVSVKGQF